MWARVGLGEYLEDLCRALSIVCIVCARALTFSPSRLDLRMPTMRVDPDISQCVRTTLPRGLSPVAWCRPSGFYASDLWSIS